MHLPRHALALVAASLVAVAGCKPADPNDPSTHIQKLSGNDAKVIADAARELRKLKATAAVPNLVELLKHENMDVRNEAAYALAEIGDKAAVQPLIDAIDLATTAKGADRVNMRVAFALGELGDHKATPALVKIVDGARDPLVRDAALKGLGALKDPKAVPTLLKLVTDDNAPPLLTKHAIVALGDMRTVEAVPALARAMVLERQGVSFFLEASYALFQVGAPAAEALSKILTGEDKEYVAWAAEKKRVPAGYLSKAAIVLSDLGEASAVPSLVKLVNWNEPNGDQVQQFIVRKTAAEALGRLRAAEGAAVITAQVDVEEANVREAFAAALAHIDATSSLAKIEAAAKNLKSPWSARQAAISGLSLLGNAKNKAAIEANIAHEAAGKAAENCMKEAGNPNELEMMKKARCDKENETRPKFLEAQLARLMAGEECAKDAKCWTTKLADKEPKVRERAAYELGKIGDPSSVDALVKAAKDDDLHARRAAYIALDWFTRVPAAKDAMKAAYEPLKTQLAEEDGRAYTIVVNEDLKRVVWKLSLLQS